MIQNSLTFEFSKKFAKKLCFHHTSRIAKLKCHFYHTALLQKLTSKFVCFFYLMSFILSGTYYRNMLMTQEQLPVIWVYCEFLIFQQNIVSAQWAHSLLVYLISNIRNGRHRRYVKPVAPTLMAYLVLQSSIFRVYYLTIDYMHGHFNVLVWLSLIHISSPRD